MKDIRYPISIVAATIFNEQARQLSCACCWSVLLYVRLRCDLKGSYLNDEQEPNLQDNTIIQRQQTKK